jgi:hypothetical protein
MYIFFESTFQKSSYNQLSNYFRERLIFFMTKLNEYEFDNIDEEFSKWTYLFFDCMHEKDTKRYLSEDYAFCRRWQELGGEVWLDPIVKLDHIGHYTFNGNVSKMFYSSSGGDIL